MPSYDNSIRGATWFLGLLFICGMVATARGEDLNAEPQMTSIPTTIPNPVNEVTVEPNTTDYPTTIPTTEEPLTDSTTSETSTELAESEAISRTPEMEKKPDVRLPTSLKPIHYTIKLQPLINGNFSILGYVNIVIEVVETTSNITLQITDVITHNDTVKVMTYSEKELENSSSLSIKMHQYDHERDFYIIHLQEPLEEGKTYMVSMNFMGYLNDQMRGFYRSSYRDEDGNERWLAGTQFQPTHARKAFPCFDEPGLKATFEVYLARQENMSSISNMPLAESMPMPDQEGWFWDYFNTSVPMSTYLVAFVVSDFVHLNATSANGTLFRVWARESAIKQTEYALEIGPEILTHFEDYFQVLYPLPKQDMIALPDFAPGAMENWGLITYRETAMLFDPLRSSPSNKLWNAMVVSHELAHQWFGNIVTPKWWDDLWLNEGFASFVQYIGVDSVEPDWKVMEQFVISTLQSVFNMDSLESSHPISIPVGHPDEISQIFDSISYYKGASIIRMMSHFLTEESFKKGVTNYLIAFQYENAVQDDLWHYLTLAAHEEGTLPKDLTVKIIMDTWTLQMGFPVIKVMRSADGMTATASQKRFILNTNKNSTMKDDHDYMWWVPLNYATQETPDFTDTRPMVWMKDTEKEVTLQSLPSNDQWVILNLQETGYYKVNYDENNWNLLIQQLMADHEVIHTINRAQLIDDAMDLARAGQLSYDTALGIYGYLGNEAEYVPWKAAVNNLGYITQMFKRTGGYGALQRYIRDMVVPLYDSVGFKDHASDPLLEHFKRKTAISWACSLRHQNCLDTSLTLFRQWMQNPENTTIISPNLNFIVYCRAIEAGDEEEWNFAWDRYLKTNVASEKSTLLSALGCTKKIWLLARYLEMAYKENSGIRKQDSDKVFSSVANNEIGQPLAWNYLRDNWDMIFKYHGKANKREIMSATGGFNTNQQLREVELFQKDHEKDLGAASRIVTNILESIRNNIAWMENNYDIIINFLTKKNYGIRLATL